MEKIIPEFDITLSVKPEPVGEVQQPSDGATAAGQQELPVPVAATQIKVRSGELLVVTGPNGVGKSALLGEIARDLAAKGALVETFFGSRHIQFQSDEIDQVGQNLDTFQQQLRHNVTRFRHPWGEQHLKSVVRRVANRQSQSAHDIIAAQETGTEFSKAVSDNPQVIKTINMVFEAARLPIQIILENGILRAKRGSSQYGIDRLSDGERAALLIVGAVLIQPTNSFIVVDEPERHLNPAISGALLAALVRSRSDIGFIFATHDLNLVEWLNPTEVIHLRDSFVIRSDPEERRFDLTLLTDLEQLPDELRFAILGSRRLLLLVEGEATSEDKALYGHLYPEWNVVARGGWETVTTGVRSLSGNRMYHWIHAAGIIDRDGRDDQERSRLAEERVFCLPRPTIENLFLAPTVIEEMAGAIHELKGGETGPERVERLKSELATLISKCKDEIVVRRLVWEGNRRLSEQKLSAKSVRSGQAEISAIDLGPIRQRLEADFDTAAAGPDPIVLMQDLPIKNSPIPAKVAEVLGYGNFRDYARVVLRQIEVGSSAGVAILDAVRKEMPLLPT